MTSPFVGSWSYRSFQNNPDLAVPFNALRFGAGTLALTEPTFGQVAGTLGGPGWSLALAGHYTYGNPNHARFQGSGDVDGEGWVYDYVGYLVPTWPNGVNQTPAIVGSVIRTVPHIPTGAGQYRFVRVVRVLIFPRARSCVGFVLPAERQVIPRSRGTDANVP